MLLALAFILALCLRLVYIWEASRTPFFTGLVVDQLAYDGWARMIAAGHWLGSEAFYQDPLYPYLLAAVYSVFGRNLALVYVLQALLSSLCCFAMYGIARRGLGDARTGLLAAFLWATFKVDFFYNAQLLKASVAVVLVVLVLWLLLVSRDRMSLFAAAGAGLSLGLLLLMRGNMLLVAPLLLIWLAYVLVKQHKKRAAPVLALALVFIALPPGITAIRNRVVTGEILVTTAQGGPNFYMGNFQGNKWGTGVDPPFAQRYPGVESEDFEKEAERRTGRDLSSSETSRFWFKETMREIKADAGLFVVRLGRKALLTINRFELTDNLGYDFFAEHYSVLLKLPLPGFWLAAPFGIAGLVLALYQRKGGLLAVFAGGYALTLLVFYVLSRYRLLLAPALLVFSAYGLVSLWDAARQREFKFLIAYVCIAAVLFAASYPRWLEPSYDSMWTKAGLARMQHGQYTEAIKAYQRAVSINPGLFQAWMGMGAAMEERRRLSESRQAYEKAVSIKPDSPFAHFSLGSVLAKEGDVSRARKEYQRALSLDPGYVPARQALEALD